MKRKKRSTTNIDITVSNNNKNSDLPFDLVFDILTRLPVKSLIQFKTVCKTWYSLIVHNPTFIKLHLTRSKTNTNPILSSLLVTNSDFKTRLFTIRLQSRDKTHVPNPNTIINPNIISFEHHPRILGICDGLVCATFENSDTIICNPTIGRVRKLPRFTLLEIRSDNIVFNGFGLKDDDYKLFRIVYPRSLNQVFVRGEVYSMNTGIWREIGVKNGVIDPRVDWESFNLVPVAINEVFYWVAFSSCSTYLASFDMKGYVFSVIFCPGLIGPSTDSGQLIDLKGELALTLFFDIYWFELWGFNDKDGSWTLKIRTGYHPSISRGLKCLGCEGNGNLLMQYYHYSPEKVIKLFSYDPESLGIMGLSFGILKEDYNNVYLYVESLLLV